MHARLPVANQLRRGRANTRRGPFGRGEKRVNDALGKELPADGGGRVDGLSSHLLFIMSPYNILGIRDEVFFTWT